VGRASSPSKNYPGRAGSPTHRPAPQQWRVKRFPVICGPTAGGKSAVSLALAALLRDTSSAGAEVVSADAFQIYRGMDIGTAKPSPDELKQAPHHLIDIVEPDQPFSAAQWVGLAERTIADIQERSAVPIVVGGTHLYVKSLVDGMMQGPEPDEALREELRAMDASERRAELERVDPDAASRIHPNDERRTVRALEVFRQTGSPISELQAQWDAAGRDDVLLVQLSWPTELINQRINARVQAMVADGLEGEVRALLDAGKLGAQAREAIGYKQIISALEQNRPIEEAIERIKIDTRRLAKQQRTWLRRLGAWGNESSRLEIPMDRTAPADAAGLIAERLALKNA